MIRYSPKGFERIKAYKANVDERIQSGSLTPEEGAILIANAMRAEAHGSTPHKVRCPDCFLVHVFIGEGSTFCCSCSPSVKRSVWDCRA